MRTKLQRNGIKKGFSIKLLPSVMQLTSCQDVNTGVKSYRAGQTKNWKLIKPSRLSYRGRWGGRDGNQVWYIFRRFSRVSQFWHFFTNNLQMFLLCSTPSSASKPFEKVQLFPLKINSYPHILIFHFRIASYPHNQKTSHLHILTLWHIETSCKGPAVSLTCVASGNPPPRISW